MKRYPLLFLWTFLALVTSCSNEEEPKECPCYYSPALQQYITSKETEDYWVTKKKEGLTDEERETLYGLAVDCTVQCN